MTSRLESVASVGPSAEPVTRTKTRKSRFRTYSSSGLRLRLPDFSSARQAASGRWRSTEGLEGDASRIDELLRRC